MNDHSDNFQFLSNYINKVNPFGKVPLKMDRNAIHVLDIKINKILLCLCYNKQIVYPACWTYHDMSTFSRIICIAMTREMETFFLSWKFIKENKKARRKERKRALDQEKKRKFLD